MCTTHLQTICPSVTTVVKYWTQQILVEDIGNVLNETNTDVHMYIEEFILVDVVTLLYKDEMIYNGKYTGIYTSATID